MDLYLHACLKAYAVAPDRLCLHRRGVDIADVSLVRTYDANAEIRAMAKAHTQARVREACAAHTLHTVMIAMGISELCRHGV